jgi:hypothetical protein
MESTWHRAGSANPTAVRSRSVQPSSQSGLYLGSYVILCSGKRWMNCAPQKRWSASSSACPPQPTPLSLGTVAHLQVAGALPPLLRLAGLAVGPDLLGGQEGAVLLQHGRVGPVREPAQEGREDRGQEAALVVVQEDCARWGGGVSNRPMESEP